MAETSVAARRVGTMRAGGVWMQWVLATVVGELLGFAAPSVVGALFAGPIERLGPPLAGIVLLAAIVPAGMVEGAVLAWAQGIVLRHHIPGFAMRAWVAATALAAGLAYLIAMLPHTLVDTSTTDPAVVAVAGGALGLLFVLAMGGAQWLVLRASLPRAGWWVAANAVAWPLGVLVPVVALSLVPDGAPLPAWIAVGIASGAAMGVLVGAITGAVLVWLLRGREA
jgi:hypothetical protein